MPVIVWVLSLAASLRTRSMNYRVWLPLFIVVFSGFGGVHAAGQSAVVVRDAQVKAGPAFGARTSGTAAAGSRVVLGTRFGGWQQVTLLPERDIEGWLRVYQVRTDIENPEVLVKGDDNEESGALSGLAAVSRRSTSLFGRREMDRHEGGGLTATIGIRGLSEADLADARPDTGQLKRLKENAVGIADVRRYAQRIGLKSRKIKPLPVPAKDGS